MKNSPIDTTIHFIGPFTVFAGVTTLCGCGMQQKGTSHEFTSNINYWGKTGIVKAPPFATVTLDERLVDCKPCLTLLEDYER